jgi:hypothetical protein
MPWTNNLAVEQNAFRERSTSMRAFAVYGTYAFAGLDEQNTTPFNLDGFHLFVAKIAQPSEVSTANLHLDLAFARQKGPAKLFPAA